MEARTRFGGRILTVEGDDGTPCDLGPSWFWPGQPLVTSLLNHFDIPYFEQYVDGAVLFQQMDGRIDRITDASPMTGSLRIQGGVNHLTNVIADEIDASHQLLAHMVTGLSIDNDVITVDAIGPSGKVQVEAKQVALAIPPRLALLNWHLYLNYRKKRCKHWPKHLPGWQGMRSFLRPMMSHFGG